MESQQLAKSGSGSTRRFWLVCAGLVALMLVAPLFPLLRYYSAELRVRFKKLEVPSADFISVAGQYSYLPGEFQSTNIVREDRVSEFTTGYPACEISLASIRKWFSERRTQSLDPTLYRVGPSEDGYSVEPDSIRFVVSEGPLYIVSRDNPLPILEYRLRPDSSTQSPKIRRLVLILQPGFEFSSVRMGEHVTIGVSDR